MEAFKDLINDLFFERLKIILHEIDNQFDFDIFLSKIYNEKWKEKELKQRTRHIAVCLNDTLNLEYTTAIKFIKSISQKAKRDKPSNNNLGFLFLPEFIEAYGLEYFNESMDVIEEITELMSCEFAVRPFIIKYKSVMTGKMFDWSNSENHHLRRLASEGCRPRLPWAMQLPEFIKNPNPILPILYNLVEDESEYVRKSVANNLNDISKDNPEIVIEFIKNFIGKNKETDKLLKHAARTLLKKADPQVYSLFGLGNDINYQLNKFQINQLNLNKGDDLFFEFELINNGNTKSNFRLEYAVYYLKNNGKHSRKLFMISEKQLETKETIKIVRKQSFRDFTIRKHYPGMHKIAIVVNGKESNSLEFNLISSAET